MTSTASAKVYSPFNETICEIELRVEADVFEKQRGRYWQRKNGRIDILNFFSKQMIVRDSVRAIQKPCGRFEEFKENHPCFPEACHKDRPIWCSRASHKTIVLLMESPHKDEYMLQNGTGEVTPIAPANGQTGNRIRDHIGNVARQMHLEAQEQYRLLLCNPVPYQCSLHHLLGREDKDGMNSKLRDKVWRSLWNSNDLAFPCWLERRLKAYDPDHIVNACTSGLKGRIETFLKRKFPNGNLWTTRHPSVWNEHTRLCRITSNKESTI